MTEARDLEALFSNLSPEARRFVGRVVQIEKSKLYMGLPRGVNDELLQALEESVR